MVQGEAVFILVFHFQLSDLITAKLELVSVRCIVDYFNSLNSGRLRMIIIFQRFQPINCDVH